MTKPIVSREELIKHADAILLSHEDVLKHQIDSLYSKMPASECRFCRRIWPDIINMDEPPKEKIYLSTLQASSGQTMSKISQQVEKMQNQGLVIWERGESGTYIQMTGKGFRLYHEQMEILLSYMQRVINKLGVERVQEITKAVADLKDALTSEMPAFERAPEI